MSQFIKATLDNLILKAEDNYNKVNQLLDEIINNYNINFADFKKILSKIKFFNNETNNSIGYYNEMPETVAFTDEDLMPETIAFADEDEMPETIAFTDEDLMPETVAFTDEDLMPETVALNSDIAVQSVNNIPIATITRMSNGDIIKISKEDFVIGKQYDKVDYFINDNNTISRKHAMIKYKNNCFYLIDLGSSNHSYVDGVMANVNEWYTLFKGSRFYLSDEEFIFNIT